MGQRGPGCWLCDEPGLNVVFDLENQLSALGWRRIARRREWICRACSLEEEQITASTRASTGIGACSQDDARRG
jgi:hypothetical protein